MSDRTRQVMRAGAVIGICLMLLLVIQGCGKEEPAAPSSAKATSIESAAMAAQDTAETAQETAEASANKVVAAAEQTTCPVMEGNPINKNLFVEYEGKKVYFCCKGCEQTFLADPAKYVAKLPQFQQ